MTRARSLANRASDIVSVRDFGAVGDGSQTLFSTSYSSDILSSAVTYTQQTADGIAINKAIVELRSNGGGRLCIPKGTYRVYGYLERIDFPCEIVGDGEGLTVLKNCDASPTNANGYGIFCIEPTTQSDVSIRDLTLDGNATVRTQPTAEWRSYPLAIYGTVNARVDNITSKNSPIDCLYTGYANSAASSLTVSNTTLSNSYRNTLSCVAGWNQLWTNCLIEKGGKVYSGTNPKYCIDIEPNLAATTIRNITFVNCIVRDAENVLAGGIWAGNVKFVGCSFQAYGSTQTDLPYLGFWRGGEFTFTGCTFENFTSYRGIMTLSNPVGTGDFASNEFTSFNACRFVGTGLQGYGLNMRITDCEFQSSLRPVLFEGTGTQQLILKNTTLLNVIDNNNFGSGTFSSFAIKSTVEGYVEIDGLTIKIVPSMLPTSPAFSGPASLYGIFVSPTPSASEVKISNVHVSGFYQKYPTNYAYVLNASNYRDWNTPNLPPADTAGQTAAPAAIYYRNCTMYGNNP